MGTTVNGALSHIWDLWNNPRMGWLVKLACLWLPLLAFNWILWVKKTELEQYGTLGYVGLFVVATLSSATLMVPGPSLLTVLMAGAVYHPLIVGLIMGFGSALGEITGYLAGVAGQGAASKSRIYVVVERWMREWGFITLFLLAATPTVFFDIAGIVAGATRYDLTRFVLAAVLGKIVRFTAGAYLGMAGIEYLSSLLK